MFLCELLLKDLFLVSITSKAPKLELIQLTSEKSGCIWRQSYTKLQFKLRTEDFYIEEIEINHTRKINETKNIVRLRESLKRLYYE